MTVVGCGYLGAVHAAAMAEIGHDVVGFDVDEAKVALLNTGRTPFYEPGLDELLERTLATGRLRFTTSYQEAADNGDVIFLCVGTPQRKDSNAADLVYVRSAVENLAPLLTRPALVLGKSTVPVGTAEWVRDTLRELSPAGDGVRLAWNPEFLREGFAVKDTLSPDRLVVGVDDPADAEELARVYGPILEQGMPWVVVDLATAQLVKNAANAFLATKLSFINAIAAVCEGVGADVNDVVVGMGYDKRIGTEFLRPGPGWGGSCFPKDSRALLKIANEAGYKFDLLAGVIAVNDEMFDRVTDKIRRAAEGSLRGKTVAVWGLTFKARTDDLRDSPSVSIINRILAAGGKVKAFDPTVEGPKPGVPADVEVCTDPYSATAGADVLAVLTEWDDFRWLEPEKVAEVMTGRQVIDGRNLLDRSDWQRAGFAHQGLGR